AGRMASRPAAPHIPPVWFPLRIARTSAAITLRSYYATHCHQGVKWLREKSGYGKKRSGPVNSSAPTPTGARTAGSSHGGDVHLSVAGHRQCRTVGGPERHLAGAQPRGLPVVDPHLPA